MMNQLNLTLWAWVESARGIGRRFVWRPFLILAAIEMVILLAFTQAWRPVLSWLMIPMLKLLGAGGALHYPQLYVYLPALFGQANVVVDWIPGSFLFAAAFLAIRNAAVGQDRSPAFGPAGRSFFALLILRLPVIVLALGIYMGLPRLVGGAGPAPHGNTLRLIRYGTFLLGEAVEALVIYAPLLLLTQRESVAGAFRRSIALAVRNPVATFLIVLVPNLLQLPISAGLRRSDLMVRSLAPETVAWLVGAGIAVYVLVNYFVIASAVRVFGARAPDLRGGTLRGDA